MIVRGAMEIWRLEGRKVEENEEMRDLRMEVRLIREEMTAIRRSFEEIETRILEGPREERRRRNAENVYGWAWRREEEDAKVEKGRRAAGGAHQGEGRGQGQK